GGVFCDLLKIVVIEMSKLDYTLNKRVEELTGIEMWGLFFGYAQDPKYREIINNIIRTKEEVGMATELLLEVSQDQEERARIMSRKKFLMDQTSNLITAEKRGMIAGRAEIFDLLAQGVPIDEIKKRFGL
ncbi:MAG: Rpn family recombination-promoting nuclease/putative transposase, partial [Chitinispirillales bacterium]|nr:Rpn family recombination-promoting nuclease/putative transposase [Chitinispirillales bacterium]